MPSYCNSEWPAAWERDRPGMGQKSGYMGITLPKALPETYKWEPHKAKKTQKRRKHRRTQEENNAHLAKLKAMGQFVKEHHQAAKTIFIENNAFVKVEGIAPIVSALNFVQKRLDLCTEKRRDGVDDSKKASFERGETDKKVVRQEVTHYLATLKTPQIDQEKLDKHLKSIQDYFGDNPAFMDFYNVSSKPEMTYLSTAILYLKTVKHQIMKAAAHKARHLPKTEEIEKFLEHNDKAGDLLHKMHKGWKAHLVRPELPNHIEHNKLLRHFMHSKFREWKHGHEDVKKIPGYIRRFDPAYKPPPRRSPPQPA